MALNPYINSFDTQAEYEEYIDGSTVKAPNVAYIRATDEMKYTKTVPNPTWIIYGTTSGTTDFYIGAITKYHSASASNGIHLHVQDGIFYATAEDVVGTIAVFYDNKSGFANTEGKKITKLKRWTYPNTNITDTGAMFTHCPGITSIDLSSFNTANVTNMGSMFYGTSVTSLDLTSFNTSNVTSMDTMFYECTSLTTLDLSSFNTSNVTDMSSMFYLCNKLTSLDLSSFNTANVTSMWQLFYGCSSLTTLDISGFDTTKVTSMNYIFQGCRNINKLILGPNFFNSTSFSTFDFSQLTAWTDADSLETFVQAAEVHDGTGKEINLSDQSLNALTQAQKDRITGAGWTLS